jgi:phospholipid transport system transporter-binding protein
LGLAAIGANGAGTIQVDCSGITASDSAGMAVLLDWLAIATHRKRSLQFGSLPQQVQAIARISDVLELLERGVQPA